MQYFFFKFTKITFFQAVKLVMPLKNINIHCTLHLLDGISLERTPDHPGPKIRSVTGSSCRSTLNRCCTAWKQGCLYISNLENVWAILVDILERNSIQATPNPAEKINPIYSSLIWMDPNKFSIRLIQARIDFQLMSIERDLKRFLEWFRYKFQNGL